MKLSKHFSLEELCKSQTATRLGINNLAKDKNVITNLKKNLRKYIGTNKRKLWNTI